jgi:hypothetical protein
MNTLMKRISFFLFWVVAMHTYLLSAAEAPTITVRKSDTLNVAFSGISGTEGATLSKILGNDLTLAGLLLVLFPQQGSCKEKSLIELALSSFPRATQKIPALLFIIFAMILWKRSPDILVLP